LAGLTAGELEVVQELVEKMSADVSGFLIFQGQILVLE
jgi:hypothetical protein